VDLSWGNEQETTRSLTYASDPAVSEPVVIPGEKNTVNYYWRLLEGGWKASLLVASGIFIVYSFL
jgi:hypothetical protein